MQKKEGKLLINKLKSVALRKADYILSKKIVLENEIYSLIKLFFKGYFEIEQEVSFMDLIDYLEKINLKEEVKEDAIIFLRELNETVYSGSGFSKEDFNQILNNFKNLVEELIKEKENLSLFKEGLKHALKTPFIKRLFIKNKNVPLDTTKSQSEKKYGSVREKLIDDINNSVGFNSIKKDEEEFMSKIVKDTNEKPEEKQGASFKKYGPKDSFFKIPTSSKAENLDFNSPDDHEENNKNEPTTEEESNSIKDKSITPHGMENIDWSADVESTFKNGSQSSNKNVSSDNKSILNRFKEAESQEDKLNDYLDNKKGVFSKKFSSSNEKILVEAENYMDKASSKLNKILEKQNDSKENSKFINSTSYHLKLNKFVERLNKDIKEKDIHQLIINYKHALDLYKLLKKQEKKLFYSELIKAYNFIKDYKKNKGELV